MTYAEYAKKNEVTPEAIGAKFRARYPGTKFDKHAEVAADFSSPSTKKRSANKSVAPTLFLRNDAKDTNDEELAKLREQLNAANEATRRLQEELDKAAIESLDNEPDIEQSSFQWMLDGINLAEILLVIIGSVLLLGISGLIVGAIACAFYAHTVIKIRDKTVSAGAKDLGLSVCAVLCIGFAWLHGQSFSVILREDITGELRYNIGVVLSWAMTLIPLFSLFQTRNVNE